MTGTRMATLKGSITVTVATTLLKHGGEEWTGSSGEEHHSGRGGWCSELRAGIMHEYTYIYICIYRERERSIYLSIYLSIYPSIYLSIYPSCGYPRFLARLEGPGMVLIYTMEVTISLCFHVCDARKSLNKPFLASLLPKGPKYL